MSMHKRKADESETDSGDGKKGKNHPIFQRCSNLPILQGCSSRKKKIEETKLFLCLRILGCGKVLWFRIDPPHTTTEDSKISIPELLCTVPAEEISLNCGMAALGSKIYMVGGDHEVQLSEGSNDMLSFDTAADDGDFVCHKEEHSHLLVKRGPATAVSTHGKLYVFGSVADESHWGEVFDPRLNSWSPLPEPPSLLRLNEWIRFYSAVMGDKILLRSSDTLFSFDVKTNEWEDITSIHSLLCEELSSIGVAFDDNILFSYDQGSVRAYDFSSKRWLKVKGLGMRSFSSDTPEELYDGYVVRLGENTFCVVWSDEGKGKVYVRCLKFRVNRVNYSNGHIHYFQGEVEGRSTYQIPFNRISFHACFGI